MKFKFLKKIASLVSLIVLAAPMLPAYAAGASISLSANKSTVTTGGSVIVAIYMNGGGNSVNAVQADLTYPASKLQYVGFSSSGSAFEIGASSGGGDGSASVSRGTTSPVSGSALVGTMTFKALGTSGSAAISVAGSSSLVADGGSIAYSPSGTSVNFGAEPLAASTPGATTKTAPKAVEAPKDTTPPVITAIKAKDVTPFSASITWTTNEASDSVVEYGVDANYGLSATWASPTTSHYIGLTSAFLQPKTLLHYRVKSTDEAGNVSTSPDQSLQLPGVSVTVQVRGPDGKPQSGVTVTIDNASGTTDGQGQVTLPATLGNKKITSTYQGVTVQKDITVAKTTKPLPPYQLDLSRQPVNHWMLTSIGLVVLVLTLLGIDAILFGSKLFTTIANKMHHPEPLTRNVGAAHGKATVEDEETPAAAPEKDLPQAAERPVKAALAVDAVAPKPIVTEPKSEARAPVPVVAEPVEPADPMEKVVKLMGGPPDSSTAEQPEPKLESEQATAKVRKIGHFANGPSAAPIKINLQPLNDVKPVAKTPVTVERSTAPSLPTNSASATTAPIVIKLADEPETQASQVAKRLKKPAKSKTTKRKPATKKPVKK